VNQPAAAGTARYFAERYGHDAAGTWFAPGRVNLLGGPDYNDVFVLPFALSVGVCAAASRRSDRRIALTSRQAGGEPVLLDIDTLEPGSPPGSHVGWAAYPAGVAWALRQAGYLAGGADVAIDADLPAGAGLSSSAALECSVALALTELYQAPVPRRELAAAGLTLLVIDTRARHALTDGQYASRRQACEEAASRLGVRSLRDVTGDPGALARLTDPSLRRLAGHVVAENGRLLRAVDLLRAGDQAAIGELLTASHRSLRDEFRMSWPQADAAVEAAVDAGAAGARMTGGGFGGSVVALVPAGRAAQVRAAVTRRFTQHDWPAPHYLEAVPSDGARRIG